MWTEDQTVVVAGNGPTLESLEPGRILATDRIVRTNNFFFEPHSFLGLRVDLAFMAGDPRVAPFMFETLWRAGQDYDLRAWVSHDARVRAAGQRRFADRMQPLRYRDGHVERGVAALIDRYQRMPNTGTRAVLAAHGFGARRILLAGMDLHQGTRRYVYAPGPHMRALLGQDLAHRATDRHLHDPDLDREIFALLMARDDVDLARADASAALADVMPLAPIRSGPAPDRRARQAPTDWVPWVGPYPIRLLRALRRASAVVRGPRTDPTQPARRGAP